MKKVDRSEIASRLRNLPAMQSALESLDEQIRCACMELEGVRCQLSEQDEVRERDIAHREFLIYEQLVIQRNAVFVKVQDLQRALSLLSEEEQRLLAAFFSPTYTKDTPFDLMEECGYEKTQLYARRAKALDRLAMAIHLITESNGNQGGL